MSLGEKKGGRLVFLKSKEGSFYIKGDETPYSYVNGWISKIIFRNQIFDGGEVEQMNLNILSEDGSTYVISIRVESRAWKNLCGALLAVNPKEKVTVNIGFEEPKDAKPRSFYWVTQNNATVKSVFSKSHPNPIELPEWKKAVIGKRTVYDNSEETQTIKELLSKLEFSAPQITPTSAPPKEYQEKPFEKELTKPESVEDDASGDDFPF